MRTALLSIVLVAAAHGQFPIFGPVTLESQGSLAPQTGLASTSCFQSSTDLGGISGTSLVFTTPVQLEPTDTNTYTDVYVRNIASGVTTLTSATAGGTAANGCSYSRRISGDGRYVVFATDATNIVPGMSGHREIIWVDLQTGAREIISVGLGGAPSTGLSGQPDVSDNGRFVVFSSLADNLVPGDTEGNRDIFMRDRLLGTTTRVTQTPAGVGGLANSTSPRISGDGGAVLFRTQSGNIITNNPVGVVAATWLVYDVATQVIDIASIGSTGIQPGSAFGPAGISDDGRYVAFHSSTILEPDAPTSAIYVRDRLAGLTEMVVRSSAGVPGNNTSSDPDISGSGRFVAFTSQADNLVPDDTNGVYDVFVHDRVTGTTIRASVSTRGAQIEGIPAVPGIPSIRADSPALDGAGRRVAFVSNASILAQRPLCNDPWCVDVFVADLGPGENLGFATAGSACVPYLRFVEQASPFPWTLSLRHAPPGATAFLALSTAPGPPLVLPFGTIVPWPVDATATLITDQNGTFVLPFSWPASIPPATQFWVQAAVADPGASFGFTLSNAHLVERP